MIHGIIVDDEPHCSDALQELLVPHAERIGIVAVCATAAEAIAAIGKHQPDVVFLDVQLGGKTGFDILKHVAPVTFQVVFTTAYEAYAVQAFRFSALDYLLKPIDRGDFDETMVRVYQHTHHQQLGRQLEVLLENLSAAGGPKKITVPTTAGYRFLNTADIIHCRSDINYTHIHTVQGQQYTVAKTLKHFEELLTPHHFLRIHPSHLVNLKYVDRYVRGKGGTVTLVDGTSLEVSARRKDALLKRMR